MGRLASAKALTSTNTVLQTTHNKLIDLLDAGYIVEGNVNDHIIRVEVTPSGGFKIFRDDVLVSGIDASGNAIFSGDISAASGTFSGTVSGATINGGTINGTAIYIPNSTSPVFSVNSSGVMSATSGTFSGTISGSTITGGSINIGSGRFDVNSSGDVYARYLRIGTDGCDVEGYAYFDDDLHVDGSLSSRYYDGDINSIGTDNCGTSSWAWNSVWAYDTSINSPSDKRLKKDVVPIKNGVELILNLNPIQYKWNDGKRDHYGLIAQEVKETMTKVGIEDAGIFLDTSIEGMQDGKEPFYGLRYGEFISPMIQTIQYLEQRIKDLENKLGSV